MSFLSGKKVLLGVTGSIAAYKSAYLVRELIKRGAEVKVILTPAARDFVSPLTLGTLSKNPVLSDLVKNEESGVWNNHVELGLWADLMVIAPASANTLAKMAHGEADNLLLTTYLSAKCPVFFAPAMDLDMHAHGANQDNIKTLVARKNIHIPSESGELASGLEGEGRLAEPSAIADQIESFYRKRAPLVGRKVLITSGPTEEPIDPVRYIGNRSTGKMGASLVKIAIELGAEVEVVSGPVGLKYASEAKVTAIQTAAEMYDAVLQKFPDADIAIFAAAVSDYRPAKSFSEKLKKSNRELQIQLEPTRDILLSCGKNRKPDQILVGFALETENGLDNARKKLEKKNCDFIVLNIQGEAGVGFGHDTNKVTFVERNNVKELELKSKEEVARDIFSRIIEIMK
jgi:phosphopantothenoylcysteine decarboxylase/phosphopantothenate--cysteine ligase